jgi:hypothetical protein
VSFSDPVDSLAGSTTLNINTTTITDGTNKAPLSNVFAAVNKDSQVVLNSVLHVKDGDANTGDFTLKCDTAGTTNSDGTTNTAGVFGAKIAFLEDDAT